MEVKQTDRAEVGVLVVGHGRFAAEMVDCLLSVVGELDGVEGIACREDAGRDEIRRAILAALDRVDQGSGVIIFTDMFGDTASNICVDVAQARPGVEVLAGVNMPMLLKLTTERGERRSVAELADFLREYGRAHIVRPEIRRARGREAGA